MKNDIYNPAFFQKIYSSDKNTILMNCNLKFDNNFEGIKYQIIYLEYCEEQLNLSKGSIVNKLITRSILKDAINFRKRCLDYLKKDKNRRIDLQKFKIENPTNEISGQQFFEIVMDKCRSNFTEEELDEQLIFLESFDALRYGFTLSHLYGSKILYSSPFNKLLRKEIRLRRKLLDIKNQDKFKRNNENVQLDDNVYNAFKKKGDSWEIIYNGIKIPLLKEYKALKYIQYLLKHQGKEFHVSDLCDIVEKKEVSADMVQSKMDPRKSNLRWEKEGLPISGEKGYKVQVDYDAMKDVRRRLKQLSIDRKEAEETDDEITIKEIDEETKELQRYMIGKKDDIGQIIGMSHQTKKDYDRVKKNIDRLYLKINNEDCKDFYLHLKNSIHIHTYCIYYPDRYIPWNF